MKKKPKLRVYAIAKSDVSIDKTKDHIKRRLYGTRISTIETEDDNIVTFYVPLWMLNKAWSYLQKKRGIKKVWVGTN